MQIVPAEVVRAPGRTQRKSEPQSEPQSESQSESETEEEAQCARRSRRPARRRGAAEWLALLALPVAALSATPERALATPEAEAAPFPGPSPAATETGPGEGARRAAEPSPPGAYDPPLEVLSGEGVYERVLENRFDSYVQMSTLRSGDRAGNEQETRLRMWFRSFHDGSEPSVPGQVLSKSLVKYTHPFDLRHSGYLIINLFDRPNDQFVYLASNRRVRRVNLRGEAVFGTDFSFEDVLPKELEDATYRRIPDSMLDGVPCFAIELFPKEQMRSEYSRLEILVEKERAVPLFTRYWDDREIEIKQLRTDRASIELMNDIWVPRRLTMRHLKLGSFTELRVTEIEPNPVLPRTVFDLRRLEGH